MAHTPVEDQLAAERTSRAFVDLDRIPLFTLRSRRDRVPGWVGAFPEPHDSDNIAVIEDCIQLLDEICQEQSSQSGMIQAALVGALMGLLGAEATAGSGGLQQILFVVVAVVLIAITVIGISKPHGDWIRAVRLRQQFRRRLQELAPAQG